MPNLSQFYPTTVDQNNFVYTTGYQRISGQKDFALRPTVNGTPVVLYGEFCPEDNSGGNISAISGDVVFITGNQDVYDNKRFEYASNLEGAPFLASGEGKYLEKYFDIEFNANITSYNSPTYPNSIIFVTSNAINTYSIFLPPVSGSKNGDFIKYLFRGDVVFPGSNSVSDPDTLDSIFWYVSGCPSTDPAPLSGYNCLDCVDCYINGSGNILNTNSYYISGLQFDFYTDGLTPSGAYSGNILFTSLISPVFNDSISFAFKDNAWYIENENNHNIPEHVHNINDIIGLPEALAQQASGAYIHLEKVFNHTFRDGFDILYSPEYERNSYVNLIFDTESPCYLNLPNPTGNVLNGDRILFNVQSLIQSPERLIIRHNQFDGSGNYLPYNTLFNLPRPVTNDAIEFWYQEPEWRVKFAPFGQNFGGSGSNSGGNGSGCCDVISFAGNRVITRTTWPPTNFNPQAEDVVTFLNRVFYPFRSAVLNLNGYPLKELGTTFSNINFNGNITQNDEVINGISNLRLFNGNTVIQTINSPSFGNFNYGTALSLTNNATLSARVNVSNGGNPIELISSQAVNFEAPWYYGAGDPNLNEAQIKLVLTKLLEQKSNKTKSYTADNKKLYIVIPIYWGLFNSIKDQNGFQTLNGWSSRIVEFTLANGVTKQNYYIWETNNLVFNVNNFNYTFEF